MSGREKSERRVGNGNEDAPASHGKPGQNGSPTRRATATQGATAKRGATARRSGKPKNNADRITIKSVAEAAGVSIATVSFVLNERPGQVISEPVKRRVLEAAKALNYAPSAAAAGLARKSTRNVSVVFYKNDHLITNQLYSFIVQGAIKEASEREFNILFSFMPHDFVDYGDLPQVVREKNAEGVLFIQDVGGSLVEELSSRGLAVVGVDSHPYVPELNTIYVDNVDGARQATQHLVELGHRDFAFLRAGIDRPSIAERSTGFLEALESFNLSIDRKKRLVEAKELTFQAGYERAKALLQRRSSLSALFCANDEMAAGVIRAAHEVGRRIPQDLSVVGFDDIIMSRYLDPSLTTIGFDKEEMGRRAMRRLLQLIADPSNPARRDLLPVELIKRDSTQRPL